MHESEQDPAAQRSGSRPLLLSEIPALLRRKNAENGRFHLCSRAPAVTDEAAAWQETTAATALFLAAFAKMVVVLLLEPESEAAEGALVGAGLHATWNFDYYRWSLWVADRAEENAVVLLELSSPG